MKLLFLSAFLCTLFICCVQPQQKKEAVMVDEGWKQSEEHADTWYRKDHPNKDIPNLFPEEISTDGSCPVVSKKKFKATFNACQKNQTVLTWEILKFEMEESSRLGYTFGKWQYTTQMENGEDTTLYGNCVSVWIKQADGSWKVVPDACTAVVPIKNTSS